jgi:ribonuclease J
LAERLGIPKVITPFDGVAVRLAPGEGEKIGTVPVGRLALDGNRILYRDSEILRNRRRILYNGCAVVTVVVDADGEFVKPPMIVAPGLLDINDGPILDFAADAAINAVQQMPAKSLSDDGSLQEMVRRAIRRALHHKTGKRPVTYVHIVRV